MALVGQQGDQWMKAEEIGSIWGTVNYEVLCGLGARVPRVYL
jgi:alanine racemase